MFGSKTPFLFPHESVPHLRDCRSDKAWVELVDHVATLPETHEDSLAFQLMVIHMAGCLRCTNYKANLGCTVCSQRAVRNTKAPISTIMRWFKRAQNEVREFLTTFTEENKAVAGGDDRRAA